MRRAIRAASTVMLLAALALTSGCVTTPQQTSPPRPIRTVVPDRVPAQDATPAPDAARAYAIARVARMTLSQKVSTLLMLHVPGTDPAALRAFIERHHPGGFILMGSNIPDDEGSLHAITAALSPDPGLPVIVGIDQEGGVVRRIDDDPTPGARVLQHEPPAATRDAFTTRSQLLARLGITVNFGIVADVTDNPSSFIADRVLGTTPAAAAQRVAAAVTGEHGRILSTLKHFPGHGEVSADSHHTIPVTAVTIDRWREHDAPPFRAGIDAGAEFVMFGHLAYSAVDDEPASLSRRWHEILRNELGFDGIAITDAMLMLRDSGSVEYQDAASVAVRAIAAGNDLLLYVLPADPATAGADPASIVAAVVRAVDDGTLDETVVDAAAARVLTVRRALSDSRMPLRGCDARCRAEAG